MYLSLSLLLITCLFSLYMGVRARERAKRKKEGGPVAERKYFPGPTHLPVIGAMLSFAIIKLRTWHLPHHRRAHLLNKVYGKTCTGWAGWLSILCTADFDVAQEIFHSPDFGSRVTSHPRFRDPTFGKNLGIFLSGGEPWKVLRKYTIRTLRQFGFGEVKATEAFIDDELQYFFAMLDRDRTRGEICMRKYFKLSLFNCMWRAIAGTRCEEGDKQIERLIEDVEAASSIEVGFDVEWVFPSLRYMPGFDKSWQLVKALWRVQQFFGDVMKERRRTGSYRAGPPTNFIDHFLQVLDEERGKPDTHFTDEQFMATGGDMLCASSDTTANTVEFTVLYLLRNPHVLAKFRAELDSVVGLDRSPNYDDFKRMPYAKALLFEVLRNCNILPIIGRGSSCDTIVAGHFVPKDVLVGINVAGIHKDPDLWGDPANFRPERFLDEKEQNIVNEEKLLAFGAGKHACLGETMAKVMWFKFVAGLVQRYDLHPSSSNRRLSVQTKGGLTSAPEPFYAVITPRADIGSWKTGQGQMCARARAPQQG